MLVVTSTVQIRRPAAEVEAQFADVAHHQTHAPHRGAEFRVLRDSAEACEYEQVTRLGPVGSTQQFLLDRTAPGYPGEQVNRIVAGPFTGGSITFAIQDAGEATEVRATVRHDPGPVSRLAAPVLRRVLGRSLAAALEEDRVDLESGRYAAERTPKGPAGEL